MTFSATAPEPDKAVKARERSTVLYTAAWKLVHLLSTGPDPSYHARFDAMLNAIRAGTRSREAFLEQFGADLPQLEAAYRQYLVQGRLSRRHRDGSAVLVVHGMAGRSARYPEPLRRGDGCRLPRHRPRPGVRVARVADGSAREDPAAPSGSRREAITLPLTCAHVRRALTGRSRAVHAPFTRRTRARGEPFSCAALPP